MALAAAACSSVPLTDPGVLVVGDCFDAETEGDVVPGVELRLCTEPHAFEFFASASLDTAGAYPDESAFRAAARDVCVERLEVYADVWAADKTYDYGFFYPSVEDWAAGERTLGCYLYDYSGEDLEASVRVSPPPSRVPHGGLRPGDCFDAPPTDLVYTLPTKSCDIPHDYEAFGAFDLVEEADAPYPGLAAIEQSVAEQCPATLDTFAPGVRNSVAVTYSFYGPSEEAWVGGERRVVCFAHAVDGSLVGSIRGPYQIRDGA